MAFASVDILDVLTRRLDDHPDAGYPAVTRAEVEAARDEIARLREVIDADIKGIHDEAAARTFLDGMGPDEKGAWAMQFHGDQCAALAVMWWDCFGETGAENYLEGRIHLDTHNLSIIVTAQAQGKPTAHDLRRKAEAERDARLPVFTGPLPDASTVQEGTQACFLRNGEWTCATASAENCTPCGPSRRWEGEWAEAHPADSTRHIILPCPA